MLLFCYFLLLLVVVVVVVVVGYSFSITACFYLRDIHRDHFMETARVRFLSVRAGGCVVFRNSVWEGGGGGGEFKRWGGKGGGGGGGGGGCQL